MELAQARKARITPRMGGRILADALVAQGIDHVFSVPGESFLDTLDGLYDVRQKLKLVTCRFEAGAVNMAEAYGKLTGRPAAAMVTRGPGACHGAIGVHIAMQDSTPLLLFVGQIPHGDAGRDAFQEIDYRRMFGSVAKWVTQIDETRRIPEIVAHAVDVATAGRPGPVVIALSEEMQREIAEVGGRAARRRSPARIPIPAAFAKLRAMLAKARKPVAVLGGSCWSAAGRSAIRDFLLANAIPVTTGFRRQALYDGTLDNFAGDLGVGSDPGLLAKVKEADLILAIGSRLGDAVTQGYTLLDMAGSVPIVQVHPDGAEIGRVFRPALGIVADLNAFALAAAAAGAGAPRTGPPGPRSCARCARRSARCRTTRARSTSATRCATWNGCWTTMRSSPPMPAISPAGPRDSSISATSSAISARPTARWATACRPRSAPRSCSPTAWWCPWSATAGS